MRALKMPPLLMLLSGPLLLVAKQRLFNHTRRGRSRGRVFLHGKVRVLRFYLWVH